MVTHPHQWAQEWTHTHTKQMTSLQLPGASTSVGPHGHRVILCNRQSPPTIKNSPAFDSWDVALLYWILSTQSCFSAATGHEQDAVVKWHSIFSARLLCFLSPLPVITDNMQVSVHPVVYFIWAGTASSPSSISEFFIWMWLLEESRLPCYIYPHVYAHDHFKWLAFHWWILTHLSVALFHFHSMQIKHSDYQKEQHEPEQQCAPTSGRVAAAKKW